MDIFFFLSPPSPPFHPSTKITILVLNTILLPIPLRKTIRPIMSDTKAQTIQSEAILEKQLIDQLLAEGYTRAVIPDEGTLVENIHQHVKDQDGILLYNKVLILQKHSVNGGNLLKFSSLKKNNISYFYNLSSLDDKTAHLQQQLTSYRQFKKAPLQQMFV